MRYLALYRSEAVDEGATPDPEHMAAMGELIERMMKSGALIDTGPLAPRAQGARVRLSKGKISVTDEDERMSGYAFLEAPSREAAIEMAKEFLRVAGDGVSEIRQIAEMGPPR